MGSQEQPWALEQHGAQSAVQSKSLCFFICTNIIYSSDAFKKTYFSFLWLLIITYYRWFDWNERHMFVEYNTYLLCYLASKSITCPSHQLCTCVFVFSSSRLTWTTPSWRRTGLISESSCRRSITRGAFALSSQIQTCDTEWSLNPTLLHSFSQLILQCGGMDH